MGGGGGSGSSANITEADLINGEDYDDAETYWECLSHHDGQVFAMDLEFYTDGSGTQDTTNALLDFRYRLKDSILVLDYKFNSNHYEVLEINEVKTTLKVRLFRSFVFGIQTYPSELGTVIGCQWREYE